MKTVYAFLLLLLASTAVAEDPPATPTADAAPRKFVLLRNGEVLEGIITIDGRQAELVDQGARVRLRASDVAFVGQSLRELYEHQRRGHRATLAIDRLRLADWCFKQGLTTEGSTELAEAKSLGADPADLARLERRAAALVAVTTKAPPSSTPKPSPHLLAPTPGELERFVRGLPRDAVETFSDSVQPLLINSCTTSGCHSIHSGTQFALLRGPGGRPANRSMTLRNLYAVMQQVDNEQPDASPLLRQAAAAHGPLKAAAMNDEESERLERLAQWIARATRASRPMVSPDRVVERAQTASFAAPKAPPSTADQHSAAELFGQIEPGEPGEPGPFSPDNPRPLNDAAANEAAPPSSDAEDPFDPERFDSGQP